MANGGIAEANAAGLYRITYTAYITGFRPADPTVNNNYSIAVQLQVGSAQPEALGGGGVPSQASPASMQLYHGPVSASQTTSLPVLPPDGTVPAYRGAVGLVNSFVLIPKDGEGNEVKYDPFNPVNFNVFVQNITGSVVLVEPYVRDNLDGTYSPYFSMDKVGTYNIWVWLCDGVCNTVNEEPIGDGNQIEFTLIPGANDFSQFTASGPGVSEAVAVGEASSFRIVPRDAYGNNRFDEGNLVSELQAGISITVRTGSAVRRNPPPSPAVLGGLRIMRVSWHLAASF